MDTASFNLVIKGPAMESGEIDVRDLASALFAISAVIEEANAVLNGDKTKSSVRLVATRKGSVCIGLALHQSMLDQALQLFDVLGKNKDGIAAAKDILTILFGSAGLFEILKRIKGRKITNIEDKEKSSLIVIEDDIYETDKKTIELLKNINIRENTKKFVSALSRDGVDSIDIIGEQNEPLIQIEKTDLPSYDIPEQPKESELIEDRELNMFLQIDSLGFKDGTKWKVTDGGESFYASLEDEHFKTQIDQDAIQFSKNDVLHCKVHVKQSIASDGKLRKEYRILQVLHHKKHSQQLKLM